MTWELLSETLRLEHYNTRLVVFGVAFLGATAGLVGSFLLLRKQSLLGDALSHATLPGIGIAFAVMAAMGLSGATSPASFSVPRSPGFSECSSSSPSVAPPV